jgi:uncharacterized membrane protein YfcA
VSAPLLLLAGLPLSTVVVVNLTIALITRIVVVARFREDITVRRVALLVLGSIPGLVLGTQVLSHVNMRALRIVVGCLVVVLAPLLMRPRVGEMRVEGTGQRLAAGFAGGVLGATASLNGVPAVMLLSRSGLAPRNFIADLAGYFVVSNLIGVLLLTLGTGTAPATALLYVVAWLPLSIIANTIGTSLAPRLPVRMFRKMTLVLILAAGLVTAVTA